MVEIGSQLFLYGRLLPHPTFPTIDYKIDNVSGELPQVPLLGGALT
jgi:hypothetical protein